ncbi:hypothetical protein [Clostridium sp. BNL1100]|uniref:hypothetical protein n=1 Tax=Clostridium sp. BNL1100 TaxID=755731 RepID=UPI00024A7F28|nr:hypothetical protein [Clostridium sp. BNL1100]AEY65825.1 hypothetical protein Clo1100_1611 [Clostridium sp. BNL1100]
MILDNNVKTIKLFNIVEENVNDYLQEVLFLLEYYNPWVFQLGHISSFEYMYDKNLIKKFKSKVIKHSKYTEPIYFFNEAIKRYYSNPEDETVFLYFYKVIEYFFFINRKAEIIKIISDNISDMDKLLKGMNDIYKTEERRCLTYVLRNELVETNINKILLKAKKNKLILKKNSESLAKGIYDYRNSIVHGKGDSNLKLRIPWSLDEDIILVLWNQIIKELAIVCISVFCYDNVLLTS